MGDVSEGKEGAEETELLVGEDARERRSGGRSGAGFGGGGGGGFGNVVVDESAGHGEGVGSSDRTSELLLLGAVLGFELGEDGVVR